jgi:hypothetical protein
MLITLVGASVAWGILGAWTVGQHASAAAQVASSSEPLSLDARQLYQSLSDADVTATTAFLAGPPEPLAVRQRYEADLARAAADLSALRAADANAADAPALAGISADLPVYAGYVQQAQTYSALGHPLTGGSFMQVASEQMHLRLLPAARRIYASQNAALGAASARATGLPLIVIVLLLAVAIGVALLRAQRWLTRRTHRIVNYGLLAATAAVIIATAWLAVAFTTARTDLERSLGHGSTPAELLARAAIAAQQARADEVLNLISRSGSASFQQDFTAMRTTVGPGPGSLLAGAAGAAPPGSGASAVATAERDARSWYAVAGQVFRLDVAANYAAETRLVIAPGAGGSAAGFSKLESDIGRGIAADQVVFAAGANAGSGALGGLEAGIVVAALIMAAGSGWGLSRRLAEYR